eukprot:TRINITY_DN107301_c0_g1_i1.p1 TRINITY_DN107301_c0_g1~~TRINITY_DN107301_c0_g1_i1.p1  ORF type:complete len:236 (-),score=29.47 TRINITY_DN107301_c0_g1_i1:11-718(-)
MAAGRAYNHGSRRGACPGLLPSERKGAGICLPPMTSRPAAKPREPVLSRRDKGHEERVVLQEALEGIPAQTPSTQARNCKIPESKPPPQNSAVEPGLLEITVLRGQKVKPLKIEISPLLTVDDLKGAIAQLAAIPPEDQRLYWRWHRLPDTEATLASCGLTAGQHDVNLVPELSYRTGVAAMCARRGFNMVPAGQPTPWSPKATALKIEDVRHFFGEVTDGVLKVPNKGRLALGN